MSLCLNCGRCCWNFKDNDPADKCDHLADDMRTCLIYGQLDHAQACGGLFPNWPDPHHAVDLPEDCGFVLYWKEKGII